MGGDGESSILTDLRHLAAFVRDPCTVVSCVLLPFSSSVRLEMQVSFQLMGNYNCSFECQA